VSALVLDAGALVAVDRDDRAMIARLRAAEKQGLELRSNAMVVAQAWRDRLGRQAGLARLLRAVDVRPVAHSDGRAAGVLMAAAGTADAIDATVVLLAGPGDRILTSDPGDLTRLAAAGASRPMIIAC
jgi:DNA-binding transcriptional MocR family regulator